MTLGSSGPPDVPTLSRKSDMLRVGYCAALEETERLRAARARHRQATLLGLSITLEAVAAGTITASAATHDDDKSHTLRTVAETTAVVGAASLLTVVVDYLFNKPADYDQRAATAAQGAIDIVALSDKKPAAGADDSADANKAQKAFDRCLKLEDVDGTSNGGAKP